MTFPLLPNHSCWEARILEVGAIPVERQIQAPVPVGREQMSRSYTKLSGGSSPSWPTKGTTVLSSDPMLTIVPLEGTMPTP